MSDFGIATITDGEPLIIVVRGNIPYPHPLKGPRLPLDVQAIELGSRILDEWAEGFSDWQGEVVKLRAKRIKDPTHCIIAECHICGKIAKMSPSDGVCWNCEGDYRARKKLGLSLSPEMRRAERKYREWQRLRERLRRESRFGFAHI